MLNESRRGDRKKVLFWKQNKTFLRKVRAPHGQACWVIPSAGNREDSATETYRLILMYGKGARVW